MKTYPGRNTYKQLQKRSLPVSVHLSESDLLFQCIPLLKYIKVPSNHIFKMTTAVLFGMACLNSCVRNKQKLQSRAARVITKSCYNTNSSYLLNSLSWDNLSVRRTKQKVNLTYKCVNKLAPNYLCNMFTPRTLPFDLRDASQKLYLPKPRTDYLKRSFSYSGTSLWNDLPEDIRNAKSLRNFKRGIDKWLFVSDSHTANM